MSQIVRRRLVAMLLIIACGLLAQTELARGAEVTWKSLGSGGGGAYLGEAVFKPSDPNFAMVGTDTAGVLKTTNGGATWTLAMEGLVGQTPQQTTYVRDLAVDPSAQDTVYLATFGLYRTTDFGAHWSSVAPLHIYHAVAVDPSDPNWVFAGEDGTNPGPTQIIRSPNKWGTAMSTLPGCNGATGPSCTASLPQCLATSSKVALLGGQQNPDVRDIVVDPQNASVLIAATDCGLYRSHDRGGSWDPPTSSSSYDVYSRLVLHGPTHTLYAGMDPSIALALETFSLADQDETNWAYAVTMRRSTDWGATWTSVSGSNSIDVLGSAGDFEAGSGETLSGWQLSLYQSTGTATRACNPGVTPYGSCAAKVTRPASPTGEFGTWIRALPNRLVDPNTVYLVSVRARVEGGGTPTLPAFPLHSEVHFYDINNNEISWPTEKWEPANQAIGTQSRVLPVVSGNRNDTWLRYEVPIRTPARAHSMSFSVGMYSGDGTMSPVTAVFLDDVRFERSEKLPAFTGIREFAYPAARAYGAYQQIAVDPTNPMVLYAMSDARTNWNDPATGDFKGVWKSTDGGTTWLLKTRVLPHNATNVTDTKWDGGMDGTLLAIGSGTAGHLTLLAGTLFNLYRTTDGGETWSETTYNVAQQEMPDHLGHYSSRGAINNVYANFVATDPNQPQRIYYGDADNFLQVSHNGGASFVMEGGGLDWDNPSYATRGWKVPPSSLGNYTDSPDALVIDPADSNHVFVGASIHPLGCGLDAQGVSKCPNEGGVVQGAYNPTSDVWAWTPLGTQSCLLKGGPVSLVRDRASGRMIAGVMNSGLARLEGGSTWVSLGANCMLTSSRWFEPQGTVPPFDWWISRLVQSPTPNSKRIFAGFGNPSLGALQDVSRFSVWKSDDLGDNWTNITWGPPLQGLPVIDLLAVSDTEVFAATFGSYVTGLGGLYHGVESGGTWTWTRVLKEQRVTGVARSPFNPKLMYAISGQLFGGKVPESTPGIYRSVNGGIDWTLLARNGLDNLFDVRLDFSTHDRLKLYASTRGAGVFEGTLDDCDTPGSFDCSKKMFFTLSATGSNPPPPTLSGVSGPIAKTDIVSYDPSNGHFARFFQVSDPNAVIDAFTKLPNGDLLLSFTAAVTLPGIAGVTGSDIVQFHPGTPGVYTAGTFSYYFDGSVFGVSGSSKNVDAIYVDAAGDLYLSINGNNANVGKSPNTNILTGVNNSDIVKFHPTATGGTFSFYFRGLSQNLDSVFLSTNASGTPQIYMSTVANFTAPFTGKRIDVLRYTGAVAPPNGTFDVYRSGAGIGLLASWQLGGLAFDP